MATKVTLEELIEAGAHFGHQSRRWDPHMEPYLYGIKDGIHVFDLTKTKELLEEALDVVKETAKKGGTILLVGTKKQAREKVEEVANETNSLFVTERWLGGTFTNLGQIKNSTRKLKEMKQKMKEGEYDDYTKKERLLFQREIDRLERFFGGIVEMEEHPDLIFVIDAKRESTAIDEAMASDVTSIAVVDSNTDPTDIDHPIPMNDDATRAVHYVLDLVKDAILEGKGDKKKAKKKKKKAKKKEANDKKKKTKKKSSGKNSKKSKKS